MFLPKPYPSTSPTPLKLATFEDQAHKLGVHDHFYRPLLTTHFEPQINTVGVYMRESTGSGNECSGTNDGSKSSVLVTYLADAWSRGAEVYCGIDVRYVMKREGENGYVIFYETTTHSGEKRTMWVIAVSHSLALWMHTIVVVPEIDIGSERTRYVRSGRPWNDRNTS